jgi:hypothetical protein
LPEKNSHRLQRRQVIRVAAMPTWNASGRAISRLLLWKPMWQSGLPKRRCRSGFWLYRTGAHAEHPVVLYDYRENRKAENPKEFLNGFQGYLHTDGYAAYHKLPEGFYAWVMRLSAAPKSLLGKAVHHTREQWP